MLVSSKIDRSFFAGLQAVIVDEVHAFAGDDRGWHLLGVLSRIERLCGREFQRIGLSATVGNPEELLDWLSGSCKGQRQVCHPPEAVTVPAEVKLDYVGSLHNAAVVISRLHRGEKRLVFVDSRSQAEQLGRELRALEVTTFITHSSLSQEERSQAEEAFASRDDCVIVATSVLELGIDVGDLHRVIQIDAPATVSSFLQRMGRTGRRHGTARNCLFLATGDDALLRAAALVELWSSGYIEPVLPPPEPYHILVVANFPVNFSDDAARRLVSIATGGGRCGVYALISVDTKQQLPRAFPMADLERQATVVDWTEGRFVSADPDLRELPLSVLEPPANDVFSRIVRNAGRNAKDARRVEVPFERIAPAVDQLWTLDSRSGIDVPLGRAGATKLQHMRLGKGTSQHVLVAGKTGSGKSTLLHALIINVALYYGPDEVEFYLIDFKKGVEFKPYATHRLPHARVIAIESDREFGLSTLGQVAVRIALQCSEADAHLILSEDNTALRFDSFKSEGAVGAAPGEDHRNRSVLPALSEGTQETIDRRRTGVSSKAC